MQIRYAAVSAIAALMFLAGCREHAQPLQPQQVEDLFNRWFVSPTTTKLDSLIATGLSCSQIDELGSRSKSETMRSGADTVQLADSTGAVYTIGYNTPGSIDLGKKYPLIVYLHGGIGTTLSNKGAHAWEMLSPLCDSMDLFVASPSGNKSALWWAPVGVGRILQTVRYMTLKYPIDPDRIILAGVSDGATGCFAVANSAPAPFAGFISISGFGGMLEQFGIKLSPTNMMQRPFYVVNGGKDQLYPVKYVEEWLTRLEKAGVTLKRKIYPQEKHGFDYRDKEMGTLAGLVRTWSRPKERHGLSWFLVPSYPNFADNIISLSQSTQAVSPAQVSGFWKADTLILKASNAASMTFCAPMSAASIPVRVNDTKILQASPATSGAALYGQILHDAFPATGCRMLYKLTISD